MAVRELALSKDLETSIRAGHPWIYARAIRWGRDAPAPGEVVSLARHGQPLAVAFADPESPIGARVLDLDLDAVVNDEWVARRVRSSVELRGADPSLADCDAVRLVHGENDFLPGLVVDRYADTAVIVFDGAGAQAMWEPRLAAVIGAIEDAGVAVQRAFRRPVRGGDTGGRWVRGGAPKVLWAAEGDARFAVDVERGQKTGLFLDQRDNRRALRALAAGGDVLNLYCYSGGFSVHAGLAGARRVTSVDIAAPAIADADRNWRANGLDGAAHEGVVADVHDFLAEATRADRRWDVVVCDPPSFAPSERARQRGLRAYRAVNALAMDRVARGGVLVSASCSSHVRDHDLEAVVAYASAHVGRRARVIARSGAATDHPVAAGFPEGRYLDCLWVRLD